MAFSKNTTSLIGRAGRDPETFTTKTGTAICKFSLATDSRTKSPSGDWETSTDWHSIVCFGKLAEIVQQYVAKGTPVAVDGRISYREYTDKDGNPRKATDIIANDVYFFQRSGTSQDVDAVHHSEMDTGRHAPTQPRLDDDIPF